MEERVHSKYIVATYGGEGFITHASANTKEELVEGLKKLVLDSKITPGNFVVLRPMEGVSVKLDVDIEITIDED
jgi:hypothetical protein